MHLYALPLAVAVPLKIVSYWPAHYVSPPFNIPRSAPVLIIFAPLILYLCQLFYLILSVFAQVMGCTDKSVISSATPPSDSMSMSLQMSTIEKPSLRGKEMSRQMIRMTNPFGQP